MLGITHAEFKIEDSKKATQKTLKQEAVVENGSLDDWNNSSFDQPLTPNLNKLPIKIEQSKNKTQVEEKQITAPSPKQTIYRKMHNTSPSLFQIEPLKKVLSTTESQMQEHSFHDINFNIIQELTETEYNDL